MKEYDLVIIGAGAAGFAATIKASEITENRTRIALITAGALGGTCVNVGCVPSKYLIEASNHYFYSKKNFFKGIKLRGEFEFSKIMEGLRELVDTLRKEKYEDVIGFYENVELIKGKARFKSQREIEIVKNDGEAENITGKKFIIATGSSPSIPPIQGITEISYLTSDNIWELKEKPESLLVIGGGAIGLELGQAFLHFDTKVTIVEAADRIIVNSEPEISERLTKILSNEGMEIITKARVAKVKQENETKVIEVLTHKGTIKIKVDEVLLATGRKPNTKELNLEAAGVKTDGKGFIITNEYMKTSNPNIYAAGDVVSKALMLETLAAKEGVIAGVNSIKGNELKMDYTAIPFVVFTNPNVASVGLTEQELMQKYNTCWCKVLTLDKVPKARIINEYEGLIKIVVNPSNEKIVGIHALAPQAAEFITEGALAIKCGFTIEEMINTTHVFPTLAECIKIAAQSFRRDVTKMSCCME